MKTKLRLALGFAVLGLIFCISYFLRYDSYSTAFYDVFDTYSTITVYSRSKSEADKALNDAYEELKRLNQLYDIYNAYEGINNLKTINDNAGIKPVKADKALIDLVDFCIQSCENTEGVVDPSMGAVLRLWHEAREYSVENPQNAYIPSVEELKEAEKYVDISAVEIDKENSTIYITKKGVSLDVGAVAKGYGADRVVKLLEERGIKYGLVNLGGNVCAIGSKLGKDWTVGVKDPKNEQSDVAIVKCQNKAVVTSGDYQRYFTVNGTDYNHIIDKATLMPANRYSSVTVVADNSAVADMLSTALFVMEEDKGDSLAQKYNAKVCRVYKNGEVKGDREFIVD